MESLFADAKSMAAPHWSILIGLLVIAAYARERFNEPTFPSRDTLPKTVVPLRYLFLGSAYERARRTYVIGSLLLYLALLLPGRNVVALGIDPNTFPPQAWDLGIALLLVGLLPTAKIKWIGMLEEWLRRRVHELFLVPSEITKTIGMLQDAPYNPPASLLANLPDGQKDKIEAGLKSKRGTLHYRWARATMLIAALNQMGAGAEHPLQQSAFAPFQEDFDEISHRFRSLAQDIPTAGKTIAPEKEAALIAAVGALLRRIYAYIGWGVLQQAKSEGAMVETLAALGFSITVLRGRRLFDIVVPAIGAVAAITLTFWFGYDVVATRSWSMACDNILADLWAAVAAAIMYGWVASIALKRRSLQIERRAWQTGSARCLISIAWRAGLVSCAVIIATTILTRQSDVLRSLIALGRWDETATISGGPANDTIAAIKFLPVKIATALPWLLAGATASAVLAFLMRGDVRRIGWSQRGRDAAVLGAALGLAVLLSQLVQSAIGAHLHDIDRSPFKLAIAIGFVGFACGAVLGFMVPSACRANIVTPANPGAARILRDLLARAEVSLGTKDAAATWAFSPHDSLGGITPAEAIQYEGYQNTVRHLLEGEKSREDDREEQIAIIPAPQLQPVDA